MAGVIEAYDIVVRMKTGNKLPAEDVGRKTDYLAMLHYRHWAQRKVNVREGWLWRAEAAGPRKGDNIRLMPIDALARWPSNPSLGLCALAMTLEFLKPDIVDCAACDAFFDDVDLPGHNARAERELIKTLPVRRI